MYPQFTHLCVPQYKAFTVIQYFFNLLKQLSSVFKPQFEVQASVIEYCVYNLFFSSPPTVKQPPTIIKQSVKDYIVDPRDNIIIECEAKGNPVPT